MMKRRMLVLSLVFFSVMCLSGQDYKGTYFGFFDNGDIRGYSKVMISASSINIDMEEDWYTGKSVKKNINYEEITIPPLRFLKTADGYEWMVVLWPEGVLLSDTRKGVFFFLTKKNGMRSEILDDPWIIHSESFLKEKQKEYRAGNLMSVVGLPWASANGYGIGDKITIELANRKLPMLFLNGYISQSTPKLYYENSRLKQMKLTSKSTGKSKVVDVQDSSDFQKIDISDIINIYSDNDELILEIEDVYKGTKYKDLCIKSIIPDFTSLR